MKPKPIKIQLNFFSALFVARLKTGSSHWRKMSFVGGSHALRLKWAGFWQEVTQLPHKHKTLCIYSDYYKHTDYYSSTSPQRGRHYLKNDKPIQKWRSFDESSSWSADLQNVVRNFHRFVCCLAFCLCVVVLWLYKETGRCLEDSGTNSGTTFRKCFLFHELWHW